MPNPRPSVRRKRGRLRARMAVDATPVLDYSRSARLARFVRAALAEPEQLDEPVSR